jgi:hypothetical protein
MSRRDPYRRKIQVLVNLLGEIVRRQETLTRKDVVELLRRTYDKAKIKPIKGKATPPDIYDKEMASLYVVGKYGLGIDEEYPELFNKIFYLEKGFEEAIEKILSGEYEDARLILKGASPTGVIDSNTVARMLRTAFTKLLLGFMSEEEFAEILKKTMEAIPEEERTVRNYVRFYIAFKVAEGIYRGEIRDRMVKEAYKRAIALRLGFPKTIPNDDYVAIIAKEAFSVSDKIIEKILFVKKEQESNKEKKSL